MITIMITGSRPEAWLDRLSLGLRHMDDDALGGLRGRRPRPDDDLVDALATHYGLHAQNARDLGGGLNLNLLIENADGRYVVARAYRSYVTPDRLAAIQDARRAVAAAGIPCATPVASRSGATWIATSARGTLVEVEPYVESDAQMNSPDLLRRGLPTLGRIHTILRETTPKPAGRETRFANHIEPAHVATATATAVARIRGWDMTPAEADIARQAEVLADAVVDGERSLHPALPRQQVHGDFWDNNVLFHRDNLALVADFDFTAERARIDDLALTLYFADLQPPLLGPVERMAELRSFVDAYDSGLDDPLSTTERAALPWALARQPLWEIGVWVATLDSESLARWHAGEMPTSLQRALQIVDNIDAWTDAFA